MNRGIDGGCILLARRIQEGWISGAPPHVREIWLWILLNSNWKDHGDIKRGEVLTTYNQILDDLSWYVGFRKERYSKWNCETAMKLLMKHDMITTRRTTRGMIITVCNYDHYQDMDNYENHNGGSMRTTREPHEIRHDKERRKKGIKKDKNIPRSGEPDQVYNEVDFYLTKKKRKLKGKPLSDFNRFWETFNYKNGKSEAADSWMDVYRSSIIDDILAGAKREADRRPDIVAAGNTPKWAQGWLSGRRWEDEENTAPQINCEICRYHIDKDCQGGRDQCKSYTPTQN